MSEISNQYSDWQRPQVLLEYIGRHIHGLAVSFNRTNIVYLLTEPHNILESLFDGILMYNSRGRKCEVNRALLGPDVKGWVGTSVYK